MGFKLQGTRVPQSNDFGEYCLDFGIITSGYISKVKPFFKAYLMHLLGQQN